MARTSQYPPSVEPGLPKEWPTPTGWRRARFRDLVDVVERPVELVDDVEYQLVNAKRSRGGIVARERALGGSIRVKDQYRIDAGDFLMSARQIIHGACGVVPAGLSGAVVSNEYVVLRTWEGIETEFLRQLSFTSYFQRTCFHSSIGVDVEKMVFKIDRWLDFRVSIPPLDEQQWIAATLKAVDDAIDADEAVVEQVRRARLALIEALVGRPPSPTARVSDVGTVSYGLTVDGERRKSPRLAPYLTVANIGAESDIDLTSLKTVGTLGNDSRYLLEPGDILAIEGNANPKRIGVAAIWPGTLAGVLHQNHLMRIRPDRTKVDPEWLCYALSTKRCREQIEGSSKTTSGLHTINSSVLGGVRIPLPEIGEQRGAIAALMSVEARLRAEREAVAERRQFKTALADALLTGKIRVPIQDVA